MTLVALVVVAQTFAADPVPRVAEILSPLPCSIPLASSGLVRTKSFALDLSSTRSTQRAVVTPRATSFDVLVTDDAGHRTVTTRYVVRRAPEGGSAGLQSANPPACQLAERGAAPGAPPPELPSGCFWSWTPGEDPTLHVPQGSQCVIDVPNLQRVAI